MSTSGGADALIARPTAEIDIADVLTMGATPIEVVAADPSTAMFVPVLAILNWSSDRDALDFTGGLPQLQYAGGTPIMTFAAGFGVLGTGKFATAFGVNATRAGSLAGVPLQLTTVGGVNPGRTAGIGTLAVAAGGLGYVHGDDGAILGGLDAPHYTVNAVGALGVVLSLQNVGMGNGFDLTHNPHATNNAHGVGVGLTVNILTLTAPQGDLYVTVIGRAETYQ